VEFESEVERRREAVRLVDERVSISEVARRVGRSRRWVYEWVDRFRAEGEDGLKDRSRAPKRQPALPRSLRHDQSLKQDLKHRLVHCRSWRRWNEMDA